MKVVFQIVQDALRLYLSAFFCKVFHSMTSFTKFCHHWVALIFVISPDKVSESDLK